MKLKLLMAIILLSLTSIVSAQDKWRTLTFGVNNNVAVEGEFEYLPQFSASLDYELSNQFYISSWNGFAFNSLSSNSWFASQTTLDKRFGKNKGFLTGVGMLYTTNADGIFAPVAVGSANNKFYATVKLQYRIKL